MNQQVMPLANQEKKVINKTLGNRKSKKMEAVKSKLRQRRNNAIIFSEAHDENARNNTTADLSKFQKIDYRCLIGYVIAYGFFNFFYWIDMLYY